MNRHKDEFDERQQNERGKAFRNAFIAMFGALLLCGLIDSVLETPVLDYFAMMLIPIWVSVAVFLTTVIVRDAIDRLNQMGGWNFLSIIWGAAGLFVLVISIIKLAQQSLIADGVLNEHIVQAFISLCMIEVFVVYRVKRMADKKRNIEAEQGGEDNA